MIDAVHMNKNMVSIVVPAFNVKNYVQKCVDSLLNQTYTNIEILLIDDGSNDGTEILIQKLYVNNNRVRIFHKPNGGLSDARNYGLERIKGQYVTFVDSDDYVDDNYISHLMDMIFSGNAEIAVVGTQSFFDDTNINRDFQYTFTALDTGEAVRKMLLRNEIAHTACGKLYRSEIWNKIRFPKGLLYEDYYTTFDAFARAERVSISSDKLYFYFQRPDSIMHYSCNKRTVSIIDATEVVTPRIIGYWPDLKTEALDLQSALCMKCLQSIYESGNKELKEAEQKAIRIIRRNAGKLVCSGKIGLKDKVKIVLLMINKRLFIQVYKRFDGNRKAK